LGCSSSCSLQLKLQQPSVRYAGARWSCGNSPNGINPQRPALSPIVSSSINRRRAGGQRAQIWPGLRARPTIFHRRVEDGQTAWITMLLRYQWPFSLAWCMPLVNRNFETRFCAGSITCLPPNTPMEGGHNFGRCGRATTRESPTTTAR